MKSKNKLLTEEVEKTRKFLEEHQKKYEKLEKFTKLEHEKIVSVGMMIKKEKPVKEEPKNVKCFSRDELKLTLEQLGKLRATILEKRRN